MKNTSPYKINTITDYHQFRKLPKPRHPLISVVNCKDLEHLREQEPASMVMNFYSISLKRNFEGKIKYGHQAYDFNEGVMFFISPGQVFSIEGYKGPKHSGWILLIHPDFLWNTPLAKAIRQYEYFSYAVNEALHLSEQEENTISGIIQHIEQEYHSNIDQFSQPVMIAQLELLFTYAERFYHRQFITRKIANHRILDRFEELLSDSFRDDNLARTGLPVVQYFAKELNLSANYLGSLLKVLTGQHTQQHIHGRLIEKAKEKLSTTDLSVSEIAYELGFEHPQSFSKLFKIKTNLSPLQFRQQFS
ncbi:AraC family transcriptional regulator [Chitinophaga sp. Mgbs1]|uniref:AraC family transcriptional regulator n=1 Tax=Chitinophaga solisilvae TaxID=1233460 RepID=A0A3S1CW95_9BACT|nr:AraC family transcriptional regulator [Chitinophaga solisilvae]